MNPSPQGQAPSASNSLRRYFAITGPVKLLGCLLVCLVFVASVQAQANVTLAWNPIADPVVAGYHVCYGGASGVFTNEIDAGSATSLTISNLTPGATYYFATTTYSDSGAESAFSSGISYSAPPPPAVPLAVTSASRFNLTVTGLDSHTYDIQASPDLVNWTVIGTVTMAASGSAIFTDNDAANFTSRFYRTRDNQP